MYPRCVKYVKMKKTLNIDFMIVKKSTLFGRKSFLKVDITWKIIVIGLYTEYATKHYF